MTVFTLPTVRRRHPRLITHILRPLIAVLGMTLVSFPYFLLRGVADNVGMPHREGSILPLERVLGAGALPSERLQQFIGAPAAIVWGAFGVYALFAVTPVVVFAYIGATRPHLLVSLFTMYAVLMYGAVVFFLLMPTAPPWMAVTLDHKYQTVAVDPNKLAAFPSLHVAMPAAMAFWLASERMRTQAFAFWVLTLLTGVTVVYLGEHYVVDAIGGLLLAYTAVRVARHTRFTGWLLRGFAPMEESVSLTPRAVDDLVPAEAVAASP